MIDGYQNIAYHQWYPSLHFDKDQNSQNQTYSSVPPDEEQVKHYENRIEREGFKKNSTKIFGELGSDWFSDGH